jgi:hypothetical protein
MIVVRVWIRQDELELTQSTQRRAEQRRPDAGLFRQDSQASAFADIVERGAQLQHVAVAEKLLGTLAAFRK